MANKKYKIKNTNLLHDGTVYKIGDVIELDEKQAKKLSYVLTCVGSAENKTAKNTTKVKTETPEKDSKQNDGGEQ